MTFHRLPATSPVLPRRHFLAAGIAACVAPVAVRTGAAGLLTAASLAPARAASTVVEGQAFPGTARVADTELQLNGVGLRQVTFLNLKGYAAGLYLPHKMNRNTEVFSYPGPKRVQMRMLIGASTEEFVKAVSGGIKKNVSPAELANLQPRIDAFNALLRELKQVKRGDVVDLDYLPGKGLALTFNGTPRGNLVPGADFYGALLLIFIGDRAIDAGLRAGMLGVSAS